MSESQSELIVSSFMSLIMSTIDQYPWRNLDKLGNFCCNMSGKKSEFTVPVVDDLSRNSSTFICKGISWGNFIIMQKGVFEILTISVFC